MNKSQSLLSCFYLIFISMQSYCMENDSHAFSIDMLLPLDNNQYYWQDKANYSYAIPENLVKAYDLVCKMNDKAINKRYLSINFANISSFKDARDTRSLNYLFDNLKQWNAELAIPWSGDLSGVADILNDMLGKYGWARDILMSPLSFNNFTDNLEHLKKCVEDLNQLFVDNNRKFEKLFSSIDEVKDILQVFDNFEKNNISYEDFSNIFNQKINLVTNILHAKTTSIKAKILITVLQARANYLEKNRSAIELLLANYYQFTEHGLSRFEDITRHWALDLMPTDFYFGSKPMPHFHAPFENLKSQFAVLVDDGSYGVLETAINDYHAIPKTNERYLEERINRLKGITVLVVTLLKEKKNNITKTTLDILHSIIVRANLKADYLKKLPALGKEAKRRAQGLPVHADNVVVYTIGDMLKDLDPEKRNHYDLYVQWLRHVEQNSLTPDYFLWLEGQSTTALTKDLRHTFLTPNAKKVIFHDDGRAFNHIFRERDVSYVANGQYVYNISEDGDLYILPAFKTLTKMRKERPHLFQAVQYPSNTTLKNVLNHDTVMNGNNVLCAGIVTFEQGKIIHIDTNSGHYKPFMIHHLRPALAKLVQKYPHSISNDTEIGDYLGKINISYQKFLGVEAKYVKEKDILQPVSLQEAAKNLKKLGQNTFHTYSLLEKIEEAIIKTTDLKMGVEYDNWLCNPYTGEYFTSKEDALAKLNYELQQLLLEKVSLLEKIK